MDKSLLSASGNLRCWVFGSSKRVDTLLDVEMMLWEENIPKNVLSFSRWDKEWRTLKTIYRLVEHAIGC